MHERFLAVYCSVLYCSILQHTAPLFYIRQYSREGTTTLTNAPAISCSVLQCIILQYTATYCTIILHNAIFYRGHHYFGKCTCNFNRHEACVNAQYESHNIFLFGNNNHRIFFFFAMMITGHLLFAIVLIVITMITVVVTYFSKYAMVIAKYVSNNKTPSYGVATVSRID